MVSGFRVDADRVGRVGVEVVRLVEDLRDALGFLDRQVAGVAGGGWSGRAGAGFWAEFRVWRGGG